MADSNLPDMTALAALATGDIFYAVDNPGGTPLDRKCTIDVIDTYLSATASSLTNKVNITATGIIQGATGVFTATASITLGTASAADAQIILKNATNANTVTIQPGASAASVTYTLPTNFGAAGTQLTDAAGDGTLSWAAAGGVSWGDSITSSANETSEGLTITLNNTQDNAEECLVISTGTSAQANIGIKVTAAGASTTQKGITVDGGTTGTGHLIEAKVGANNSPSPVLYIADVGSGTYGASVMHIKSGAALMARIGSNITYPATGTFLQFDNIVWSGTLTSRITKVNTISVNRTHTAATTITDTYDAMYISKNSVINNGGGTFNTGGTVLSIRNISTQTAGTLTDTAIPLRVDQAATSSGVPIDVIQGAVVSTNFKKIMNAAGLTIWISDGTAAEGALTGVEGDICLNGGTGAGQTAFCDAAGTNWTDM